MIPQQGLFSMSLFSRCALMKYLVTLALLEFCLVGQENSLDLQHRLRKHIWTFSRSLFMQGGALEGTVSAATELV